MKKQLGSIFFLLLANMVFAQQQTDTIVSKQINKVRVKAFTNTIERMPAITGTRIWNGKKTEVLNLNGIDANIAEKTARQVFAKVPGVFVYDMDGSGNQVNISVRGLDPHRGWELNIRNNGILSNSDMYGYPASHYSMPMEAIDRIELVRGTGSLQYGAQFGGMLNYVSKQPDTTKQAAFETINSAGSFGMLSTYNALSGRIGKLDYSTYYSKRSSDGYRNNSHSDYEAQYAMLRYAINKSMVLKAEFGRSKYVYQLPGQLTDSMFYANPRQSTRSRNYYSPDIYIPSLNLEWQLSPQTKLSVTTSAVLGNRSSVMFDKTADIKDSINAATMQYNNRQVDIDNYHSFTTEAIVLHQYQMGKQIHALTLGAQLINNDLHRRQQGKGTTGNDFDLTLVTPGWGRDLHFKTRNIALFAENVFRVNNKLTVSPGIRWEHGQSDMSGTISYYNEANLPNTIKHNFVLLGVNTQFEISKNTNLYAGFAQAYRPVIFKDIIPASIYEAADKNLKDAYGYTVEAGFRGNVSGLKWDASLFHITYNNRIGALSTKDDAGNYLLYRTNIGNSATNGAELFVEYGYTLPNKIYVSLFSSTAFMQASYTKAAVKSGNNNIDISGNKVESVPGVITRNGITTKYNGASISLLYSYTAKTFADPLNTVKPSFNGAIGLVPAYGLFDINSTFRLSSNCMLRCNVNNAFNKQYFTKRPGFYPGPGIWPSDGRSFNVSIGVKL